MFDCMTRNKMTTFVAAFHLSKRFHSVGLLMSMIFISLKLCVCNTGKFQCDDDGCMGVRLGTLQLPETICTCENIWATEQSDSVTG